ncbi:MAG: serine hydrolase [Pirellulaceae bacterium]|nr:serine hydrolase [Pirellulaceae bacterium]
MKYFCFRWWVGIVLCLVSGSAGAQTPVYSIVIRGGRIVDGTGQPAFLGDVAIRDGRIVAVGEIPGRGESEIEASGLVVAPGFVDLMGQSASALLDSPDAALNLLTQGITTINCGEGASAAPLPAESGGRQGWATMREYFALLDMKGLPLNVVQTIGHTQVRELVLGDIDRRPSPEELARMEALVEEAMQAGAIGVSTALIYPPAIYAPTEEIAALVKVAGRYGGGYYTHMRNEGDLLLEAIDEALEIGRLGDASVHIFHLKTAGRQNWHKMPLAIAAIRAAREAGQGVSVDIYPYINNGLSITALVHPRHFAQGPTALMIKLDQDTGQLKQEIRHEIETTSGWENWFRHVGFDWNKIIVGQTEHPKYRTAVGQSLAEIAKLHDQDPWETFFHLLRSGAFVLPESMSEENKILAMQQDFVAFCTDVGPATGRDYAAHPRAYGAFPRLFSRYVRELKALTLEQAVAQASFVGAGHVKLSDRGRIAVGQAADIVLFDPQTIADRATFREPANLSTGVAKVLVNGAVVFADGKLTGVGTGRVLRGPGFREDSLPAAQQDSLGQPTLPAFDEMSRKFLQRHAAVGLAVAVTDQGRLVHAAGYGYADLAQRTKVTPESLFRIASISKPITAVAVLQLIERGQLQLDDPVLSRLQLAEQIEAAGTAFDARWHQVTIRHLLEHRGGWDRDKSFDAMFRSVVFANLVGVPAPADRRDVIHAMLQQPLDFDPGQRYAYSNFGYNLLGRVIESVSGQDYETYVQQQVLKPLGITDMKLGSTRWQQRQPGEVRYYHPGTAKSVFAEDLDQLVASPYGAWHLEAMDAHGGWLASATDLARFAAAFDRPEACPILSADSISGMFQRPLGAAGFEGETPKNVYYGLGWQVREVGRNSYNVWHSGSLPGTATILIRRHDGKNFVALLNSRVGPLVQHLGREIDAELHRAAAEVAEWPSTDLFGK